MSKLHPGLPADRQALLLGPAEGRRRRARPGHRRARRAHPRAARAVRACSTSCRRCAGSTPPTTGAGRRRPASASASRRRWCSSSSSPGGGRRTAPRVRRPGRAATTGCWPPSTRGCRSSSPVASARSATWSPTSSAAAHPMNRLLQGEVGSGKTLVALARDAPGGRRRRPGRAARTRPRCSPSSTTARSPRCSATSPRAACSAAPPTPPTVVLLTGSMGKAARQEAMLRIVTGEAGIVIGTHALLEDKRRVRRPRPRRRRRAAPLRRGAACRADRQGRHAAPRARHDRHPDPAHRRDDRLRRPRDVRPRRAAGRAGPHPDQRRPAGRPADVDRPRLAAGARGGRAGPPGLRRVPADLAATPGRRARPTSSTSTRTAPTSPPGVRSRPWRTSTPSWSAGPLAGLRTAVLHGRMRARRQGPHDARLRRRRDRRARVDHGHRGRGRRPQRHHDGAPRRRPVRRLASSTSCAAASAGAASPGSACWSPTPSLGTPARERLDAVAATTDGFELSRVDLEQRREGDVLGANQSGFRSGLVTLRVLRDEKTIVRARKAAEALLSEDPALAHGARPGRRRRRGGALRGVGVHGEGLTTGT